MLRKPKILHRNKNTSQVRHLYQIIKVLFFVSVTEFLFLFTSVLLLCNFEHLSFFKAFYLAIITVSTVGYGDLYPHTEAGQKTVIFLIITGVGYISFLGSMITTILIDGHIIQVWGDWYMQQKISRLRNHVIVCGLGRAGYSAVTQLISENITFVGIDPDEEKCSLIKEEGYMVIVGDATEDIVLEKAGIKYAKSVISALPDDADNILITMAAKDLNKNIRVVTRANRKENEARLKRAGADWVITVGFTGGAHLAMAAVKPATIDFMRKVLDWNNYDVKLEEFQVEEHCPLANRKLRETGLRETYGIQILAIVRNNVTLANPAPEEVFLPGDVVIAFGTAEGLGRLENCMGISCPMKPLKVNKT